MSTREPSFHDSYWGFVGTENLLFIYIYVGLCITGGPKTLTVTWVWYNLVHKNIQNIPIEKNSLGDKKIWEEIINRVNNLVFCFPLSMCATDQILDIGKKL